MNPAKGTRPRRPSSQSGGSECGEQYLRPNWHLFRRLALAIEAAGKPGLPEIPGFSGDEIGYHAYLMVNAGLANGRSVRNTGHRSEYYLINNLTLPGHEFAELARDEDEWSLALAEAERCGVVTFDDLRQLIRDRRRWNAGLNLLRQTLPPFAVAVKRVLSFSLDDHSQPLTVYPNPAPQKVPGWVRDTNTFKVAKSSGDLWEVQPENGPANSGDIRASGSEAGSSANNKFLHEKMAPENPNYDLVKSYGLKAWADSFALEAKGFSGVASISDFVNTSVAGIEDAIRVHAEFKDDNLLSEICAEIDKLVGASIELVSSALLAERERLSEETTQRAIYEFSNRVRRFASTTKEGLLRREFAKKTEPSGQRVGSTGPEAKVDEEDAFLAAFEETAAKSEQALAAIQEKLNASKRRVLYQDLQSTIWTLWQVRPDDITVRDVNRALYLLSKRSEGGVELDRASCEAHGIDYQGLVTLLQASIAHIGDMSPEPKVPRISALRAGTDQPTKKPGEATSPTGPRKRGRPAEIDIARKEAALAARERGDSWKEVAKVLYDSKYPTEQQVKNAPNVLNHYKRNRVQGRSASRDA